MGREEEGSKSMKNEIAFFSEILEAGCECCKGKASVFIFSHDPNSGEVKQVRGIEFSSLDEAVKNQSKVTEETAMTVMKLAGIDSFKKKMVEGKEANEIINKIIREQNVNLN